MSKGGDESFAQGPATAGAEAVDAEAVYEPRLADPARSRAVLIGTTGGPSGEAGPRQLAAVLADPEILGLSQDDCVVLVNPSRREALDAIGRAAALAEDALIVYFQGQAHPVRGTGVRLRLADRHVRDQSESLEILEVTHSISSSRAKLPVVLLDSITVTNAAEYSSSANGYADLDFDAPRVHLLAALSEGPAAELTGRLIAALTEGVPGGPELIGFRALLDLVPASGLDELNSSGPRSSPVAIARNRAFGFGAPSHHVPWQHDTPASRDLLQRTALAHILGMRLRQVTAEAPDVSFLVHVDGQWGAGKSTLLNLLAEDLGTDFVVVPYNAWRHSRVEPTWYPLLTAVRDTVVRSRRWYHFRFLRPRETLMRIRHAGASWFLPMAVTTAVILAGVLALRASWDPVRSGAIVSAVGPALTVAGLIWASSRVAARLFLWNSARGARIFEQSHKDPMGELAHHFGWLLRHARRPVVIFIDDLDRCDRDTVVETLEVVQNLIRESPSEDRAEAASFVVSADGAWLRCAFESHFEAFRTAIDEPGRPLGYLFQDKLFQLSVPLRFLAAEQQSSYVESLLTPERDVSPAADAEASRRIASATSEAEVVGVLRDVPAEVRVQVAAQAAVKMAEPDIRRSTEHALLKFAHVLQPNPRGIKRFLNTYTVLRTLRTLEGVPVDLDTLAAWAAIRSRWPQLADELEARPERLDELVSSEAAERGEAPAELRAFIAALPAGLTSGEVRACCGNRLRS